jgi:ATP-dependent DNA helicase RecG
MLVGVLIDSLASEPHIDGMLQVKALPLENHFEIREYNLELWDQDANETSVDGGDEMKPELEMSGRPYPVYPSKGGLQPKTLEFCIQR